MQVRCRDLSHQEEHDSEYGDIDEAVSKCEEEIKDDKYVSKHVHDVLQRFNDSTIEHVHVSSENVQDLANRSHVKEYVNWGK